MLHVLILNASLDESALSDCIVEQRDGAFVAANELCMSNPPNLHEFDAIIVDLDKLENRSGDRETRVTSELADVLNGGGLIVCFPPKTLGLSLSWLPGNFQPKEEKQGKRIKLLRHPRLMEVLERFAVDGDISYDVVFTHPASQTWTPIASTMAGSPIAGVAQNDHVIMLPRVRRPERLMPDLFKTVVPQIMPDRVTATEPQMEEPPTWVGEFPVHGTDKLGQEIDAIDQKLSTLEKKKQRKAEQLERLAGFQGLLWYKGKEHLEPVVRRALELLGVPCQKEEPKDLVYHGEEGTLFIEIGGSDNSIEVSKGRQLMDYINAEDDPASIKGAIIGNPFRKDHPDKPPPKNRPLFSPQLEKMATKQEWPLITTRELFDLVCRHQNGDTQAAVEFRRKLGLRTRSRSK